MVSRTNWLADTPRAHITNQRTMEVLRDLGIEDEAIKYATPWEQMGDTLFTTSLAGEELVRLRTWGTGDERKGDYLQGSPCGLQDIPQPLIEPVIFKNAAERGAHFSFNTEYLSHQQDGRASRPCSGIASPGANTRCGRATWSGPTGPSRRWWTSWASTSRAIWPGPARCT
jgi:2,4-dichlorophenol 6-monooxygenase